MEVYDTKFLGHDAKTGGDHRTPSTDDGSIDADDKEHQVLFP